MISASPGYEKEFRMNKYLERIHALALRCFEGEAVNIYLFGSWARGTMKHSSDVDLAIEGKGRDVAPKIASLREELEESTIPYRVDVVDMSRAAEALCEEIRREGILWKKA